MSRGVGRAGACPIMSAPSCRPHHVGNEPAAKGAVHDQMAKDHPFLAG